MTIPPEILLLRASSYAGRRMHQRQDHAGQVCLRDAGFAWSAFSRPDLVLSLIMAKSIRVITKKKRGRPVTTGKGILIAVRLQPSQLADLDNWIANQTTPLTRPEAIRAMMETVLYILSKDRAELGLKAKGTK
jgi:hypothetical protein